MRYHSETAIENTLRELFIYLCFLSLTTIICFSTNDEFRFYFNQMIRRLFLTRFTTTSNGLAISFVDIVTIEDWWEFMKTTFLDGLHGIRPSTSNNANVSQNPVPPDLPHDYQNKYIENSLLLGQPRIRQLRVGSDSCQIHRIFSEYFRKCFSKFSWYDEETENSIIKTKYVESDFHSVWTWGKLTLYPGGGFIEYLSETREQNVKILQELMDLKWVDRGTRFIAVEFSLYNANVNLFCIVKVITEIAPTGGIIPWARIQSFKLITRWSLYDFFYISCFVIFYIMILYYTTEEFSDYRKLKSKYFLSIWNCLGFSIILIGYLTLFYNIFRKFYLKSIFNNYKKYPNRFLNLQQIAHLENIYNNCMALLIFLVWIRIFKYISFNKTMTQFSTTLTRCSKDLMGFGVMFLIVFIAFAQVGYLLFGTENKSFQTLKISILTMLRMLLGDFDYPAIEAANRILGPIYFLGYIFVVFFILLNMFLAIINDTYSDVKKEKIRDPNLLKDYFRKRFKRFCDFLRCRKWRETKIDVDDMEDSKISEVQELTVRKSQIIPKIFEVVETDKNYDVSSQEIKKLDERVNRIESTLDKVLHGIDILINKLETERLSKKQKK